MFLMYKAECSNALEDLSDLSISDRNAISEKLKWKGNSLFFELLIFWTEK